MRLLEYQGKELFDQYGIRIPRSYLANSLSEAREGAKKLGYPFVLKSQLTVGGRGKAGAILKCKTEAELEPKFTELVHKEVKGELPRGILLEEMADIKKELYLSLFLNRSKRCYSLIASAEGGVEIESTGNKVVVDVPIGGISPQVAEDTAGRLGLTGNAAVAFVDLATKLSRMAGEKEAELAEINPVAILGDGSMLALDAKVIIDDNAMFRHPELKKYEHVSELEKQAEESGFSLVELDGNIAIIGNGAGLVMSTLDLVSDAGGKAGTFLDFGGRATTETIYEALTVISKIKRVQAILVNLFGGIVRTDLVAQAIIDAYKNNIIAVPVFARISGAESEKARQMLNGSKAKLYPTVEEAIQAAVAAVGKQ
ncbi:succinyl-CoA synthetase (ADP-forming) beta subunit [Candidatus Nitrososphaera evergladensis SR1]|uniref:Succinyl-CoA synthetase (ADP-forming) beta subunit n=1 Tax=Candidatus Nitrososphaera evergladensis SR1 TaxID=1459636 RepID=A0A075MRA9_9ARCH|nr:ATP-grasp domain-containing protein [Candidatus Nitrososphaera evergladensis]AIF84091.1 succinyl-CoA synthetase (ADP-forming) beta subunit [Candidatus Nitrososphaera evergladensis SR1]